MGIYKKRLVIRCWITWLWRLASQILQGVPSGLRLRITDEVPGFPGGSPGDQGESMVLMKSEGSLLGNSPLRGKADLFVLFRPSVDWIRFIHIIGHSLLTQSSLI